MNAFAYVSVIGLIACAACIIWLVISFIRKKKLSRSIIGIALSLVIFIGAGLLQGKIGNSKSAWKESDFSFYDDAGKEILFPTTEDYWISLENDCPDGQSSRGAKIGDRASTALQKYDLSDFKYEIGEQGSLNPSTEKAKAKDTELHKKYGKFSDVLPLSAELASEDLYIYAYCDIYKDNGELTSKVKSSWTKDDLLHKQKYSISFEVYSEKIQNISIESVYHSLLNIQRPDGIPDWLEALK